MFVNFGNLIVSLKCHMCSDTIVMLQRCPPVSGVEGAIDSHLRVLGEQERWNIDVLLRMLTELLPFIHQKAISTCPFAADPSTGTMPESYFSKSCLKLYAA
jgi:hypothetical protein